MAVEIFVLPLKPTALFGLGVAALMLNWGLIILHYILLPNRLAL